MGIAWVTFDSTSGTSGSATPRIFVGVANLGSNNIFESTNGGSTCMLSSTTRDQSTNNIVTGTAVAGQNNTYLPHKGVLSPSEKLLYVSYSDGTGPYDGTDGSVYKYNITSGVWTNITPVSGSDLYFGFGGVGVDLQIPGTVMVAALNSWYPDGQIFRSTDSGATWSPLWAWDGYPGIFKYYTYDDSLAPWLGPDEDVFTLGTLQIGWMMEGIYQCQNLARVLVANSLHLLPGLSIDPFDSNHWLYGTGAK